jgi:hypothetical protein
MKLWVSECLACLRKSHLGSVAPLRAIGFLTAEEREQPVETDEEEALCLLLLFAVESFK